MIFIHYASFNGSTTFNPMTPTEDAFAAELIAYWISFVRSGDPNRYRLSRSPEWPMYRSSNTTSRIVLQQGPGSTTTVSGSFVEAEPEKAKIRCAIVASQVGRQQN
jgi:carboxylesterase type B